MTEPDDIFEEILLARLAGTKAPEMSLDAYRSWIGDIAPPTDSQIQAFADYVASAHSWYKHLPLRPPGSDFHLYIDPHAGMDHLVHASGEVSMRTRTQDTEPFHYSWITTADYRERFGYLAFACAMGSSVSMDEQLLDETVLVDNNSLNPVLQIARDSAMTPPREVLEAGTCSLTALVHPRATTDFVAMRLAAKKRKQPENLGFEDETWAAIKQLWDDLEGAAGDEEERIHQVSTNPAFIALVQQQKARLRRGMIEAMQRMRSVAFADLQSAGHGDLK